jgi:hypothetical protein
MHIEPGLVNGVKIALSYATAAGAATYGIKLTLEALRQSGAFNLAARALLATIATFVFFEILPHFPVGVSEVHFILGSTLFLILGVAPAAFGLAAGLLIQGLFFASIDLPQYFMNLTSLLVPLFALSLIAKAVIAPKTAYVDLSYRQALMLSTSYQAGVVGWVAFWVFYGQGFGAETFASVGLFGMAYMSVIILETLVDLAVLALAKMMRDTPASGLIQQRVYSA